MVPKIKNNNEHLFWMYSNTLTLYNDILYVLGEHIRNWRPRYFILKDNGQFIGFKNKPTHDTDLTDPLNNFTVKNCTIVPSNRPRPFTFYIRGLHMTTVVERVFSVDNEEER